MTHGHAMMDKPRYLDRWASSSRRVHQRLREEYQEMIEEDPAGFDMFLSFARYAKDQELKVERQSYELDRLLSALRTIQGSL